MGGEVLFLPSKSVDISRLINMQNSQVIALIYSTANWLPRGSTKTRYCFVRLKIKGGLLILTRLFVRQKTEQKP
jgi:hypothetical protein